MPSKNLTFVSSRVVDDLHSGIGQNIARYQTGDFDDLAREIGWAIETKDVQHDPAFVSGLKHSNAPDAEMTNSLIVFNALKRMSPSLAREERIWVRLCHLEGLEYSRARWIGPKNPTRDVQLHFFAGNLDQCRDDNAMGRLWWNGYLANLIRPHDPEAVLKQLLKRANIRLQFMDRSNASFRLPLAQGIVRLLENEPWLDSHDRAFEHFMLVLNRNAGGLLFEASSDQEIDSFLSSSLPLAQKVHSERISP